MLAALPGVREIRSALAGGYLWIVFIWLVLDPVLGESNFKSGPYASAHHLGNEVGPLALGLAITFAAYLIGTLFNEFRGVVARIYLRARSNVSSSSPVIRGIGVIDEEERKKASEIYRRRVEKFFAPLTRRIPERKAPAKASDSVLLALANALEDAVRFSFNLFFAPLGFLRHLLELSFKLTESIQLLFVRAARRLISVRIEPYKPFLSKHGVTAVEGYLEKRENSPPEDVQPGVADVISDFPIVRVRLIHKSPDTVSEYDRLRAEAEFRSAIVPPLFMIIGLVSYKVSLWWLLAWPLLLILLATARARRREAGDILADTLGVVEAPCVEYRGNEKHGAPAQALDAAGALT